MYKLIPIIILLLAASCKKGGDSPEPSIDVNVREYGSNSPVANATVVIIYSPTSGNFREVFRGVTDNNGICPVPEKDFNNASNVMNVTASRYWDRLTILEKNPHIVLHPEGWILVYGLTNPIHAYPGAAFISMYPTGQTSGQAAFPNPIHAVDVDSMLVRAFAGEPNTLHWLLLSSSSDTLNFGGEPDVMVPKFDTVVIGHLSGY